jgi:hypothetical protein
MTEFGTVFKAYSKLAESDISKMTIQELANHNLELQRFEKLGTQLLNEIEARQSKQHKIKMANSSLNY